MNFWILSPNVKNGKDTEEWKVAIKKLQYAFLGYQDDHLLGKHFKNVIKINDIVLIAQGQNSNKISYLCGMVSSKAKLEHLAETPSLAQNRKLKYVITKAELDLLKLDFNKATWGESKQPSALYQLKPKENVKDKIIVEKLTDAINKAKRNEIMENIKMSPKRQGQIKSLWDKFKSEAKNKEQKVIALEAVLGQWKNYSEKIISDKLTLDEYTNTLGSASATMPGGYLCNFLERTSSKVIGSSKPGNADNFEVKLNNDNTTYTIKSLRLDKADKAEAEAFFETTIKPLFKSIVMAKSPDEKIRLIDSATNYSATQILMKLAVLENVNDFLSIYSNSVINELYDELIDGDAINTFEKNNSILIAAKSILNIAENDKSDLILLAWFLWEYTNAKAIADVNTPNVIMYGPPGTGKTYAVRNSLNFVCQGNRERYEIIQFHPSFAYEDFIEGIKPKGVSKDGNIKFELVNGIFKRFCIKAKKDPDNSYYFVVDEINRANLSSVFGETLTILEKDYRHDPKAPNKTANLIKTQYSTLIEQLLIEKGNNDDDLAYEYIDKRAYFGVPSNVFFIGMMNDVDKNIDAFDLALRRRFKWIRKDCKYEVIEEETKFKEKDEFTNIIQYRKACENLNNYISNDLSLGKSYEFGHSFFMKMGGIAKRREISEHNMQTLFDLYLQPTLKEYLRALFAESELDNKLNEALKRFKSSLNK